MFNFLPRVVLATAFILLLPLLAIQFTDEVVWDLTDFVVAGVLLFASGLTYELVAKKMCSTAYRSAVGVAVATALILIWINLAVGIIGKEGDPANLMYIGVLAIGLIGAIIARFEPRGMACALFAMSFAQMLIALIALYITGIGNTLILNGFFTAMWIVSAMLFRNVALERTVEPKVKPK